MRFWSSQIRTGCHYLITGEKVESKLWLSLVASG